MGVDRKWLAERQNGAFDPSLTCHADFVSDIRSDESRNQPYCASQTQTMMDMDLRI